MGYIAIYHPTSPIFCLSTCQQGPPPKVNALPALPCRPAARCWHTALDPLFRPRWAPNSHRSSPASNRSAFWVTVRGRFLRIKSHYEIPTKKVGYSRACSWEFWRYHFLVRNMRGWTLGVGGGSLNLKVPNPFPGFSMRCHLEVQHPGTRVFLEDTPVVKGNGL